MKRIFLFAIIFSLFFPSVIAAAPEDQVKAAFVREGNLWIVNKGKEKQISTTGRVEWQPKWSRDGKMLVFQLSAPSQFEKGEQQSEVWVYKVETGEKKKLFYDGYSPAWAPHQNVVAFNSKGILNVSNLQNFFNIATGVNDFAWLPDGKGFLLSSSGTLRPDGWSSASLFTKKTDDQYSDVQLFGGVESFFTLPKEIGTTKENKLIAVNAEKLTYSPSGKWISFIVSPTASWSMDSNMVCVIRNDGKNFEVMDEVILDVSEPKWAPSSDTLAFIAGGGRIVFGFKNKDLKVKEMPASGTFTPPNYADFYFDWLTDQSLVVSRFKEQEWTNDFSKQPLPSLYKVEIPANKQTQITAPPKGFGDYSPQFVRTIGKLSWFRGKSIVDQKRTVWLANPDGTSAKPWIKNVESIVFYNAK
ncbi:hypothetical protein D1B31_07475 [Neobacillus notoginsengisoli]|uniref:TolB domain-containing protein n=1 Tax=Neobacillus notoginsengisoli TaxID=1578198 RepID=A0A417YVV2_9BACI|nr:hypothetical protein [Neobacillus notoginsengisoli]RHW41553.1 hypothetical protein D1B31_07475 [Neobacillus notoginsengisoli]